MKTQSAQIGNARKLRASGVSILVFKTSLPAITAAAAVAAASTTATTAATAIFAGLSFVDLDLATSKIGAVQLGNGLFAIFLIRHFDKSETARAACFTILDDRSRLNSADTGEKLVEVKARSLK